MGLNGIQLTPASLVGASPSTQRQMLRQSVNEVVGQMFYKPMLDMARENPFKGEIGHGGRGEEMFGAQLDMELARRAALRSDNSLSESIYQRLEKGL